MPGVISTKVAKKLKGNGGLQCGQVYVYVSVLLLLLTFYVDMCVIQKKGDLEDKCEKWKVVNKTNLKWTRVGTKILNFSAKCADSKWLHHKSLKDSVQFFIHLLSETSTMSREGVNANQVYASGFPDSVSY